MLGTLSHPFWRSWDTMDNLQHLQREMNSLFDSSHTRRRGYGEFPPVMISQDKDTVTVTAEVPGVKPDDIDLTVEKDTLLLSGTREEREAGDNDVVHRRERFTGAFNRAIELPCRVNADKVNAVCRNGILTVELPRAEEDKPRAISVKVE